MVTADIALWVEGKATSFRGRSQSSSAPLQPTVSIFAGASLIPPVVMKRAPPIRITPAATPVAISARRPWVRSDSASASCSGRIIRISSEAPA